MKLSPEEQTVFNLLGDGKLVHEIVKEMNSSRMVVDIHIESLKKKHGFETLGELAKYASYPEVTVIPETDVVDPVAETVDYFELDDEEDDEDNVG